MAKRSLLLFVLGIAIGASLGFGGFYAPNQITLKILRTGKVYLEPQQNDVITWKRESGGPVQISFPFGSPCSPSSPSGTCTVTNKGIFDYTCKDSGGNVICTDPGIDPDPPCCGPSTPPPATTSPSLTTNSEVAPLQIGCDSSGNVSVLDSNSNPSPTINDGAIIQWTSPDRTFNISAISPTSSCVSSSLVAGDPVQWCNSTSSPTTHPFTVSYQVTVTGNVCPKKNTGTFSFKLK